MVREKWRDGHMLTLCVDNTLDELVCLPCACKTVGRMHSVMKNGVEL